MGGPEAGGIPMRQVSLDITAMATVYVFEADGVRLTARFFTPVFADDLELLSRPVSYLELTAESTDGKARRLEAEVRASEELCLDTARQERWRLRLAGWRTGSPLPAWAAPPSPVLVNYGDDTRIDWGISTCACRAGKPARSRCSAKATSRPRLR